MRQPRRGEWLRHHPDESSRSRAEVAHVGYEVKLIPTAIGDREWRSDADLEVDGRRAPRLDEAISVKPHVKASAFLGLADAPMVASRAIARKTVAAPAAVGAPGYGVTVRMIVTVCAELLIFGALTVAVNTCCPCVRAGANAVLTVSDTAPVP